MKTRLANINWPVITDHIHEKGFAIVPGILSKEECVNLIESYDKSSQYRKTISMERYRFGAGEYKYFKYPLPSIIQTIREEIYPRLVSVANEWMKQLNIAKEFPSAFPEMLSLCEEADQIHPAVLILKYGAGGYNTLHQDLYGDIFFPLQAVLFLNQPGQDYDGGEFVLTQQNPRAQSKAIVLRPSLGDILLFTTNLKPMRGSKGFYRVNMKHGISEVIHGNRHTLGILFHDAKT